MNGFYGNKKTKAFSSKASIAIAACLTIALLSGIIICRADNKFALKINGYKVPAQQFELILRDKAAFVASDFYTRFGAEDGPEFWTTKYGDEVPIESARKQALEDCVRKYAILKLAKEHGIIEDISYKNFLSELKQENKQRSKAVKNGETIYGPQGFSEQNYYTYKLNQIILQLKDVLMKSEFDVSETTLKKYYQEHRDEKYAKMDTITVELLRIPYSASADTNEDKKILENVIDQMHHGKSLEEAAQSAGITHPVEVRIFDAASNSTDMKADNQLLLAADQLPKDGISPVIQTQSGMAVLKCTDRAEHGYYTFEEVSASLKSRYVDQLFEDTVQHQMNESNIEINTSVYNKIMPR